MRLMLAVVVVLFIIIPPDAQMAVVEVIRPLWLSGDGRAVIIGVLAGVAVWAVAFSMGWNALATKLYHEDSKRAEQQYQSRKR